ncbi:MAG: hypothetical protein WC761_01945 [Candidatus Paceibacterota bacterium]|jgi:hypothetical protein
MEIITEGRSRHKTVPALITKHKLDTAFELKAKHGLVKGALVKCNHTVDVQTKIELAPLPETQVATETTYLTIEGGSTVMYMGPVWDHWSGKLFLEMLDGERVVFYNYWDRHQAGDEGFGTTFNKVANATVHYGVV